MGDPDDDLGEPWRWGVETARIMAERLFDLYRDLGSTTAGRFGRDLEDDIRQARIDMERWVDFSVEMFDRAFSIMRRLADDGERNGHAGERVVVAGRPGQACTGQFWVHNLSEAERDPPALRCAGLVAAGGASVEASQITFGVGSSRLAPKESREVVVTVDVPADVADGTYHGLILSDVAPETAVALCLQVAAARDE